jgi:hypothetical protein
MIRLIVSCKKLLALKVVILLLATLSACTPPIPRPDQVSTPAVGTLLPGGHEESIDTELPSGMSGMLFANQTSFPVQVIVDNTIVTIPSGQDFRFVLPPGEHQFYVYEPGFAPRTHVERLEVGKLRYVYWSRREFP